MGLLKRKTLTSVEGNQGNDSDKVIVEQNWAG